MSMPPEARHVRGGISIRLTGGDIAYIAKNIMPDELGIDPTVEKIIVPNEELLAESLCRALNDDTGNDQGWTIIFDMLERGLRQVFENGDDGMETAPIGNEHESVASG